MGPEGVSRVGYSEYSSGRCRASVRRHTQRVRLELAEHFLEAPIRLQLEYPLVPQVEYPLLTQLEYPLVPPGRVQPLEYPEIAT
jgi:hypothetical protein